MRKLILVRHAKSSWKDTSLPDFERTLNSRGKHDAPLMGRRIAARGSLPVLILSSPAKRAVSTVKPIAMELGTNVDKIVLEPRLYEANALEILSIVRELDDNNEIVLVCGHNPGLTEFAKLLSVDSPENIPTCGVVFMRIKAGKWKNLAPGGGILEEFDFPKK
jgi:phosphohistidine phosphatase